MIRPPRDLIKAGIYQQEPGLHPGQSTPNSPLKYWHLEQGKELVELVTGGRGWVQMENDTWREVTAGALLWHVPGDQTIARSDWDDPYRCLAVAFQTSRYRGVRRTVRLAWWQDLDEVERFSRELIHWYLDDRFNRDALLHYAYGRLLFQSQLWQRTEAHSDLPTKLKQAVDWISEHATSNISLRSVAQMVGWSVPHFHEVFRAKLDITPHQFVLERRIKIAKEKLVISDDPIKQVAAHCGFSNTAVFCHAFKSRVGLTPLSYRRQEREWINQQPTWLKASTNS